MRIALVVPGGVDRSGRERVIPALLWLVEELARRHTVHVFVLRHYTEPCTYPLRGATVHDLGRATGPRGFQSLRQLSQLVGELERSGPFDVVHGYWAVPAGLLVACAGRRLRLPSVATFDSGELVSLRDIGYGLRCSRRGRAAVSITARFATRLHVCSEYMQRLAEAAGYVVDRVPMGVDTNAFAPAAAGRPGPPWRLVHVASLNRVKDQPTLLRALARVVAHVPDIHLDVVGEDTLNGAVQSCCSALGLERHVSFHGFQPTERLAPFYQRAHLHVMSSRHEAAGVVVLEAAAAGLVTVGTAAGYVADWSPDATFAVPAEDDAALADAIVTLLTDSARRERMGHEARRRALARDVRETVQAMEHLYERAIHAYGSG